MQRDSEEVMIPIIIRCSRPCAAYGAHHGIAIVWKEGKRCAGEGLRFHDSGVCRSTQGRGPGKCHVADMRRLHGTPCLGRSLASACVKSYGRGLADGVKPGAGESGARWECEACVRWGTAHKAQLECVCAWDVIIAHTRSSLREYRIARRGVLPG